MKPTPALKSHEKKVFHMPKPKFYEKKIVCISLPNMQE